MAVVIELVGVPEVDRENVLHALGRDGWRQERKPGGRETLSHAEVRGADDARGRLREIGLRPEDFGIREEPTARGAAVEQRIFR